MTQATELWFTAPHQIELRQRRLPPLAADQVLVQSRYSAISAGTEMLIYRGELPQALASDSSIDALAGTLAYPLQYGYALVGQVIAQGEAVSDQWLHQDVFAFHPHATHFITTTSALLRLPTGLNPIEATLLPNMETAVSMVMDGRPLIGERVAIFGQGVVGLLTTALLAQFPLAELVTVDGLAARRTVSAEFGATKTNTPDQPLADFDLVYELSGAPAALDQAIAACGYGGRIVVGSWYGSKPVTLDLGSHFHRNHIRLISSQVSTLAAAWRGRWDKARRFEVALQQLANTDVAQLAKQRVPFHDAAHAYHQIDRKLSTHPQTIFDYTL